MFDFDVVTDEKAAPRLKAPPERREPAAGVPIPPRGETPAAAALKVPAPASPGGEATL